MNQLQRGFILPLVLIIVAVVAVGGGAYYYHRTSKPVLEMQNKPNPETTEQERQDSKAITVKKSVTVSLEEKARILANGGVCRKEGAIGEATKKDEENEYFIFSVNSYDASRKNFICVADVYAKTSLLIDTGPVCNSDGQCFGTGALPTPKKILDQWSN